MKQYLVPVLALAAVLAQAQGPQQPAQKVALATAAPPQAAAPANPSGLRQLSAEERAELRRQLYQYSVLRAKASER